MNNEKVSPRMVRCPNCGGDSLYASQNAFRPFCSARCKNVDFGAWATESYRVEAKPTSEDEDPDEPTMPEPKLDRGRSAH
jgi:endogenous inhibitor of DNA gyrase (YacG/DUF329 family)